MSITPNNAVWFISDVHLRADASHYTDAFLAFLAHIKANAARALYILGDLIDGYLGTLDAYTSVIADALASVNCPVYLARGNRDILLDGAFIRRAKAIFLPDESVQMIDQQPFFLCHGDTLTTQDTRYQYYRLLMSACAPLVCKLPPIIKKSLRCALSRDGGFYHSSPIANQQNTHANHDSARLIHYDASSLRDGCRHNQQNTAFFKDTPSHWGVDIDTMMARTRLGRIVVHGHTHRPMATDGRYVLGDWRFDGARVLAVVGAWCGMMKLYEWQWGQYV